MLDMFHVSNLGIIREARLELGPGLVVITGETGAGKTLLVGALQLLEGAAARQDQIGPFADEVSVEGLFSSDGAETVLARRIVAGGRSRAAVDGAMVPARALGTAAGELVEIVAQHDHLQLASGTGARQLVDGAMTSPESASIEAYQRAWADLLALRAEAELVGGDRRALERELDMVRFQADEIEAAGFVDGDDEELLTRVARLRNAGELVEGLSESAVALTSEHGAVHSATVAAERLNRLGAHDPAIQALADQAADAAARLSELSAEVSKAAMDLEHEPHALEALESRVALLGDLRRKYGDRLADVLAFGQAAGARADELVGLLDRADIVAADLAAAESTARDVGAKLAGVRRDVGRRLSKAALAHLLELGFAEPVLSVNVADRPPTPDGADHVELLFASHTALAPGSVSRVASGGELSRLVLALRLAGGVSEAPVVVFDEIDAGVGGVTALALAAKLADFATERQVLCVTHLPQVAAFADSHFVVRRVGAEALVSQVEGDKREEEIARMLAGIPGSRKGRDHAAELLAMAGAGLSRSAGRIEAAVTMPVS